MAVDITINASSLLPAKRPVTANRPESAQGTKAPSAVQSSEALEKIAANQAAAKEESESLVEKRFSSTEELKDLVEEANQMLQVTRRKLQFSVNEDTGKPVLRVYDADTKELIRQFPPDEILALAKIIKDMKVEPDNNSFIFSDEA
ncbi:MAG: flagellar protein FlaG [Sedimenticola sp.]